VNAPERIASILRRGRLNLAADNASTVSLERRRNPRTVADQEAYIAEYERAEYERKFNVARNILAADGCDCLKHWRASEAYRRYEIERAARNDDRRVAA